MHLSCCPKAIVMRLKVHNYKVNGWRKAFLLLPIVGIVVFVALYLLATLYYPGGTNANRYSIGFDWTNNYWCDLTGNYAKNGSPNLAQPIALTAIAILSVALSAFWYQISRWSADADRGMLMRYPGMASMAGMLLLFTHLHDAVVVVSGILGMLAIAALIGALQKNGYRALARYGLLCAVAILLNYSIYESGVLIGRLPLIQKFSFLLFLLWIGMVDYHLCLKGKII